MHFKTAVFCSILVVFEHKNMSSSPVPIEMSNRRSGEPKTSLIILFQGFLKTN